jgi:predicted type IV restriction endonuclease
MMIDEKLEALAANAPNVVASLPAPAERSKVALTHALVRPLLAALGYDLIDRASSIDHAELDFVLCHGGEPVLLVELRVGGQALDGTSPALLRAHAEAPRSVVLVTDGLRYQLHVARDGRLGAVTGMRLDLLDFDRAMLAWLRKLARRSLDLDGLHALTLEPAGPAALASALAELLEGPDPEFVELVYRRAGGGELAPEQRARVSEAVARALARIDEPEPEPASPIMAEASLGGPRALGGSEAQEMVAAEMIITTAEELAGYAIVRELVGDLLDDTRIGYRDRERFFGVIIDDDERRTLCRLHFNRVHKYIGIFSSPQSEKKHRVTGVESIRDLREPLREAARRLAALPKRTQAESSP